MCIEVLKTEWWYIHRWLFDGFMGDIKHLESVSDLEWVSENWRHSWGTATNEEIITTQRGCW